MPLCLKTVFSRAYSRCVYANNCHKEVFVYNPWLQTNRTHCKARLNSWWLGDAYMHIETGCFVHTSSCFMLNIDRDPNKQTLLITSPTRTINNTRSKSNACITQYQSFHYPAICNKHKRMKPGIIHYTESGAHEKMHHGCIISYNLTAFFLPRWLFAIRVPVLVYIQVDPNLIVAMPAGTTLTWISNHLTSKVRDEIAYPFPNKTVALLKFGNR